MDNLLFNISANEASLIEQYSFINANLTSNSIILNITILSKDFDNFIDEMKKVDIDEYFNYRRMENFVDLVRTSNIIYVRFNFTGYDIKMRCFDNGTECNCTVIAETYILANLVVDVSNKIKTVLEKDPDDYEICTQFYIKKFDKLKTIDSSKHISQFPTIYEELYPKINVQAMVKQFIEGSENILILTGKPGTGKTTFIKKVIYEMAKHYGFDLDICYVKDQEIINDNEFWGLLTEQYYELLVFDDLDYGLEPRSENSGSFVNQLLSFSDGLFDNDTKIIITTNKPIHEIDTAIIRPGRCFDILDMPYLSRIEAIHIWKTIYSMKESQFDEIFGDKPEISQAYLTSEIEKLKSKYERKYLKDTSISIRDKFIQ